MQPLPSMGEQQRPRGRTLPAHSTQRRRRPLLAASLLGAGLLAACHEVGFTCGAASGPRAPGTSRGRGDRGPRVALAAYVEMSADAGLAGFQGSEASLWTGLALFFFSLPGVWSTINRTGQAKFIEKEYVMPGPAGGGLEMRSIAGGIVAYFRNKNYALEDTAQKGKIRFIGNLQGSLSQALYLTCVVLGTFLALGFVLQSLFPKGPFELGINLWYLPMIASPAAGWFYWERAFRRDIVELQLEASEDLVETTLTVLGDKETIEEMQKGVRFKSTQGKLYQLMEKDMEYQPGMFDIDKDAMVVEQRKDPQAVAKTAA